MDLMSTKAKINPHLYPLTAVSTPHISEAVSWHGFWFITFLRAACVIYGCSYFYDSSDCNCCVPLLSSLSLSMVFLFVTVRFFTA